MSDISSAETASAEADNPVSSTGADRLSGLLAAALALGTTEFVAGLFKRVPSLVESIGNSVIDLSPSPVVKWGIRTFGEYDKHALAVGIVIISILLGALLGPATRRRRAVAPIAMSVAAAIGVAAAIQDPLAQGGWALLGAAAGVAAGTASLWWLLGLAGAPRSLTIEDADASRRRFVVTAAAGTGAAVALPVIGRSLASRYNVEAARSEVQLNTTTTTAPITTTTASAGPASSLTADAIDGITPFYVPNDEFYRIDTAFTVPQIDPANWSLRIGGLVDNPIQITFDELVERATTEVDVTLSCVSNRVGDDLVGNAKWIGVPLTEILDEAGVKPQGAQIFSTSVDGWTSGFPTELAYDGRTALVAVGMNGEPLPTAHGFPARLVVAGLYGYVSATKWLERIDLTGWFDTDGYWIPRGWAKEGPIKTQSRIDVPQFSSIEAGTHPVAGVAWAPTRGISKVEISIDEGPWVETTLGPVETEESWRQWWYEWDATPGEHTIKVRATDGTGAVQTAEERPPAPDGATGHHTRTFEVRA
ncbi:MAG: molybdopterin-dependent oxidoreductase [Acidimicrobiales bacterium]|nr:molybdopterin-dependent oxidoreductase [Acidimicrobiales bacterium]